jgi:hypothetical protein
MAAKYVLAFLSIAFLAAGALRLTRDAGKLHPRSRTWLIVGAIFALVSTWLFARG